MLVRSESVLIGVCGVLQLLVAIYVRTEFHLYSKDFEEAYGAMEGRVKQVMEKQVMSESGVWSVCCEKCVLLGDCCVLLRDY